MGDNPHLMLAAACVGTKDSKALTHRQVILPGVLFGDFAPITRSMSRKKLKALPISRIRATFEHQSSAGGYPDHTYVEERHIRYSTASSAKDVKTPPALRRTPQSRGPIGSGPAPNVPQA